MSDPTQRVTIDELSLRSDTPGATTAGPNAMMQIWFQLFRTAQIHAIDNQALQRPIAALAELTSSMLRDGRLSFQSKDKSLFVNSTKLRLSTDEFALAKDIFDFFEERGMGGFTVERPLTPDAIRKLLGILVYAPPSDRRFERMDTALKGSGIPFKINRPLGTSTKSEAEVTLERRAYTFFTYSKLVVLYRSLLAEEKPNAVRRAFLLKKIARTIHALVDICLEDDHTFLGAASVKSGDSYVPHHAANVAVLSIAIGEKLGLSKVDLADLGMAGMFYDIGLRACPSDILWRQGPLEASERVMIEQHPMWSVEYLLSERVFNRSVLSRIVTAYEHHRHDDRSGYPPGSRRPDLFSRIVAIADTFDALTTQRPWRPPHLPDEALAMMLRDSGKRFDPALLKIFVNTVGLYPIGTLVRLDSGELAVVVYGGGDAERVSRPIVAVLGSDGKPRATVDLTERMGPTYRRAIVSSEDPAKYGLHTSSFVAAYSGVSN